MERVEYHVGFRPAGCRCGKSPEEPILHRGIKVNRKTLEMAAKCRTNKGFCRAGLGALAYW
jgi:hypothetical protein